MLLLALAGATSVAPAAASLDPAVQQAGLDLLGDEHLLDRVAEAVSALGYASGDGDDYRSPKLVYLVVVSRLLPRPINLVVVGPSAAGKSFVVMLGLRLFPCGDADAWYALNGMSERLLAYTDADLRHRVLFIQEAASLHHDGIGASLLRSVAWEGSVAYETVEKTTDGLKARRIEKPGPTGFITTTTKGVEPELETRVLTVTVPDTEQATRLILAATAARANGHVPEEPDLAPWHAAQAWLAGEGVRDVTIPFAHDLSEQVPARQVRARRDFTQLLTLIQAHALLFQRQRERDEHGRVIADARDYRAVYELAGHIFGAIAAEGVTPAVRQTVEAVGGLVAALGEPVTVLKVAERLKLDKSAASRRVKAALRGGWLVNDEDKRGHPLKLRLGDPLPEDRPALPDPNDLFAFPLNNRATVQPDPQLDESGTENDGCIDGCADSTECNPIATAVAPVAERLHAPTQPPFPRHGAANGSHEAGGCTVVRQENRFPEEPEWDEWSA